MAFEFLNPAEASVQQECILLPEGTLGKQVVFYQGSDLDLFEFQLAILGVEEERGHLRNAGCGEGPNAIRKALYPLFAPSENGTLRIIDLGNIRAGETAKDTYAAVAEVVRTLIMHKVLPIVLGGSHDLTFGQFKAYEAFDVPVNLTVVDECINLDEPGDDTLTAQNFLAPILVGKPNYLFNLSHIGHQTYLNHPARIATLESLNFDCLRLGQIRQLLQDTEPLLRDTDVLSIDVSAVRMADAPGYYHAGPNGFAGEEMCQIARYAGLSDKVSSIGIYEYNPHYDNGSQTAQLIAQMIWCVMDGYLYRKPETPGEKNHDDYLKFIVKMETLDHELIFWKSKISERWWMEFPYSLMHRKNKNLLIPCSLRDYQMACKEEVPDRWMKIYNKLH